MSPEIELTTEPTWNYNDLIVFVFLAMLSIGAAQLITYLAVGALHLSKAEKALALMPAQVVLYAFLFLALFCILKMQYGRPVLESLAWVDFRFSPVVPLALGFVLAFANGIAGHLLHTSTAALPQSNSD